MPKGRVPFPFGKCTVCSDQATGNHYGAVTCEGCKGFFKRSLGKSQTYRCRGQYNCSVGTDNRIKCKACRFKRCKELGMSMSAIKMGRIPKAEKLRALENAYGDLANAAVAAAAVSAPAGSGPATPSDCELMPADCVTDDVSCVADATADGNASAGCVNLHRSGRNVSGPDSGGGGAHPYASSRSLSSLREVTCHESAAAYAANAALDLSSRPADQQRCAEPSKSEVKRGALRSLTVVNSMIAKHVRAMNGPAYGGGEEAAPPASKLCSFEEATGADGDRHGYSETVADARTLGNCAAHLPRQAGSAVQNAASPWHDGGRHPGAGPSANHHADDQDLLLMRGQLPPVELLPAKSLNDTVTAVSSAYLKMCAATRRCIDIMTRRIASGQTGADLQPITDDNQRYALEQVMVSFDLLGNKLMGFIKSCPGLDNLWTEDVLILAKSAYLGIWLVLESPLFHEGDSHMLLPNGARHGRSWMRLYLPDEFVERMHDYARAQVDARLTVPELGLMCSLLLTSRRGGRHRDLADAASVARLNSVYTQALSYEVHRGRLHPHKILANIWRLLATLQDINDSHEAMARPCRSSDSQPQVA